MTTPTTPQPTPLTPPPPSRRRAAGALPERWFAQALFASRWLLAPFYAGLVCALGGLLVIFGRELWDDISHVAVMKPENGVLMALSLIDLTLAANLVVIVTLAGYENFVGRMNAIDPARRPSWMGRMDFSGLKIRVIASIVAIAAVALLRTYLEVLEPDSHIDPSRLMWPIIMILTFAACGVLMGVMDWLSVNAEHLAADAPDDAERG